MDLLPFSNLEVWKMRSDFSGLEKKHQKDGRSVLGSQESWILYRLKYDPMGETTICWLRFYLGGAAMSCWWSLPRRNHSTTGWNFLWYCWLKFLQTVEGSSLYYIPLQFPMIYRVCCRALVIFPIYSMHLSAVWIGPPSALWHMYRYDITSGDRPRRVWLATIVDLDKRANARRQSCRAESLQRFLFDSFSSHKTLIGTRATSALLARRIHASAVSSQVAGGTWDFQVAALKLEGCRYGAIKLIKPCESHTLFQTNPGSRKWPLGRLNFHW